MSTRERDLDKLFKTTQQDVTSFANVPEEVKQLFPEGVRPGASISSTEKPPSALRSAFDYIRNLGVDLPMDVRSLAYGVEKPRETETSERIGGILDFVSGELETGAGIGDLGGAVPFAGRLFSRLDRAIQEFPQTRATGKQWLSAISKGVPEQEVSGLREFLEVNADNLLTQDEVLRFRHQMSPSPQIGEVVFGSEPSEGMRAIKQISDNKYMIGDIKVIKFPTSTNWEMFDPQGNRLGSFRDLNAATQFAQNLPHETLKPNWRPHIAGRQNAEDYSEIVLTLPGESEDLYQSLTHWPNVSNPFAHLRMTTREAQIPPPKSESLISSPRDIKIRQIDELQSDWAQEIRKEGIKQDWKDMPDVELRKNVKQGTVGKFEDIEYMGENFRVTYNEKGTPLTLSVGTGGKSIHKSFKGREDEYVNKMIKSYINASRKPDMPFSGTDQWVDISLERAIQDAIDRNIDVLTWAPGDIHYDLYGSELVQWASNKKIAKEDISNLMKKYPEMVAASNDDKILNILQEYDESQLRNFVAGSESNFWVELLKLKEEAPEVGKTIKAKRQYKGDVPELGNLEELAQQRGLQVDVDRAISSQEELEEIMLQILQTTGSKRAKKEVAKRQAEKLWKRMQTESSGVSLPRKEGHDYFYGTIIPRRLKEVGKKMGVKIDFIDIDVPYDTKLGTVRQKAIRITPELKKSAEEKGYPILGAIGASGAVVASQKSKEKSNDPMDELFD